MIRLEPSRSCEKARQNILGILWDENGLCLGQATPTALPKGSSPEERLTFEKRHEDNRKVRNIILASMTNEIHKQYDRLEDVPSIMIRMKEVYAVPDRHVRYAATKAFFGTKIAEGSSVQSHGAVLVGEASTSKAKGKGARRWKRKKGKGTAITTTAGTGGAPLASKGKVGGSQRSKANDVQVYRSIRMPQLHASLHFHLTPIVMINGSSRRDLLLNSQNFCRSIPAGAENPSLSRLCYRKLWGSHEVLERSRKLSKDEIVLRLGNGKAVAAEAVGSLSLLIWHARLGHISKDRIRRLVDSKSLEIDDLDHLPTCKSCLKGKITKKPFVGQTAIANDLLDLVHTDVCGPLSIPARGVFSFFIIFIDDHSRYGYVYLMRYKSEAFGRSNEYRLEVENQTNRKIKALRSDQRDEYLSSEFTDYLKENGILSQWTPPETPQLNGVAERRNRTLLDIVWSMMSFTELPPSF
ncbi:UNVERIFIED_CONTAM: hypothetical protein Sradi_0689900 [Sesamum radiatum]|uniref:Integrase catalytic domain-containing protein n=1 Tax=Sesamum radiatum TaxID=300843 RepID=A0AAW2VM25_SESRA